ncbi:hypothetical protein [Pararhizobium sp. PWRC1-1]|uniref:hypothetical protein n=1 Tax=Pararhizobium sp. PWRC1-1 TaxID=2804566 RepID=UPI003CFA1A52
MDIVLRIADRLLQLPVHGSLEQDIQRKTGASSSAAELSGSRLDTGIIKPEWKTALKPEWLRAVADTWVSP